ncbi:gag-pol polyprotein [Tanacetum coccineum]
MVPFNLFMERSNNESSPSDPRSRVLALTLVVRDLPINLVVVEIDVIKHGESLVDNSTSSHVLNANENNESYINDRHGNLNEMLHDLDANDGDINQEDLQQLFEEAEKPVYDGYVLGEYTGDEFDTFCRQEGIKRQFTMTYTHQHNEVAERMNRNLLERARAMLATASLGKSF